MEKQLYEKICVQGIFSFRDRESVLYTVYQQIDQPLIYFVVITAEHYISS